LRRSSLRDVQDLSGIYSVEASTIAELMTVAKRARKQGWWSQYEDLNLNLYAARSAPHARALPSLYGKSMLIVRLECAV
jgi:hypothetical protein